MKFYISKEWCEAAAKLEGDATIGAGRDSMACGIGILVTGRRKWYNPMRWIKGEIYRKRIQPKDFYV